MMSFAGVGDAGVGEASGVGESAGGGEALGVAAGVGDGLASGEFVCCWAVGWVQAARINTKPATNAERTATLIPKKCPNLLRWRVYDHLDQFNRAIERIY